MVAEDNQMKSVRELEIVVDTRNIETHIISVRRLKTLYNGVIVLEWYGNNSTFAICA
jgi:hypothetical protein